jgi:hypothetical protein
VRRRRRTVAAIVTERSQDIAHRSTNMCWYHSPLADWTISMLSLISVARFSCSSGDAAIKKGNFET